MYWVLRLNIDFMVLEYNHKSNKLSVIGEILHNNYDIIEYDILSFFTRLSLYLDRPRPSMFIYVLDLQNIISNNVLGIILIGLILTMRKICKQRSHTP